LTMRGRLGEDRDCNISDLTGRASPPLGFEGGFVVSGPCLHCTSSNALHTVPQDLAAFKFKDHSHGLIKPLKPLAKFRMPRPSASYSEIIGLGAVARRSAPWRPELTGTARGQGRWRSRSTTASGRRDRRVHWRIIRLRIVTTGYDHNRVAATAWANVRGLVVEDADGTFQEGSNGHDAAHSWIIEGAGVGPKPELAKIS
jgi:hypothetical protein